MRPVFASLPADRCATLVGTQYQYKNATPSNGAEQKNAHRFLILAKGFSRPQRGKETEGGGRRRKRGTGGRRWRAEVRSTGEGGPALEKQTATNGKTRGQTQDEMQELFVSRDA